MGLKNDFKIATIGSVHIDIFADTQLDIASGIDLPGEFVLSVGGTAFNVTAGLQVLGVPCFFISALKKGSLFTRLILQRLQQLGIKHHIVLHSDFPESAFLAMRVQGELLFAVTATCVDCATNELLNVIHSYPAQTALVDCNLSEKCLMEVVNFYPEVYICATSQVKSAKILNLKGAKNVKAIFLNQTEAFQITTLFSGQLYQLIPTHWFVTKASEGVTLVTPSGQRFDIPNPDFINVKSSSGAGDAFASGVIYAIEKLGFTPLEAINVGFHEVEKKLTLPLASTCNVDLTKVDAALFTDKLTGVYTRTLFEERKHLFKTGCIILIDIDHFKKINDTYGHQHGDQILQQVASIIKSCVRDIDEVYRYGGEEFIVVSKCSLKAAYEICNRIKTKIQNETSVTVTIGCAPLIGNLDASLAIADKALYKGKQSGRNQIVISGDNSLENLTVIQT